MVAALQRQLLSSEEVLISNSLAIESDEMINAQIVDIGILSYILIGEIQTEVCAVGANCFGKLDKRQVVL